MVLKKWKLELAAIAVILVFILVSVLSNRNTYRAIDTVVLGTFCLNGVVWGELLIYELKKHPYSLAIMHWFFCLFFFFFAALTQYLHNDYAWAVRLGNATVLKSNLCLTLWTVAVLIGNKVAQSSHKEGFTGKLKERLGNVKVKRIVLTVISFATVLFRVATVGFSNMLARSTNSTVEYVSDGTVNMMISGIFQASTFFALVISFLEWKKSRVSTVNVLYLVINSFLVLFGYFPSGLARYAMAVLYLGTLLTCTDVLKKNRNFMLLFIVAFVIILPLMNIWRYNSFSEVSVLDTVSAIVTDFTAVWLENDYDAFTELSMAIEYVEDRGTGGLHILSILFFWVPRSIWKAKALPASHDITVSRLDVSFDNVSCSLPEVAMVDGGFLGVFLFGILIGMLICMLDKTYYGKGTFQLTSILNLKDFKAWTDESCHIRKEPRNYDLLYPVVVIFFFFLIRGDLMYTFPYLVSYLVIWGVITYGMK